MSTVALVVAWAWLMLGAAWLLLWTAIELLGQLSPASRIGRVACWILWHWRYARTWDEAIQASQQKAEDLREALRRVVAERQAREGGDA